MHAPVSGPSDAVEGDMRPDRRRPQNQALMPGGRRMLTVAEVAYHVRSDEPYVRKLIAARVLKAIRPTPRKTLISEAEVCRLLGIT